METVHMTPVVQRWLGTHRRLSRCLHNPEVHPDLHSDPESRCGTAA